MKNNKDTAAKPVKVKQTGKVIGMIITDCPLCNNTISFDIQTAKFCPYCNAEVNVDLGKVEVTVKAQRTANSKSGSKKKVA
ncbi:MAG: hypothetical protein CL946_03050 [Ectothiorhodospiraceae bacterium]|nr:hypothetical protein [Ectothiorhodospiraceae bacterium]